MLIIYIIQNQNVFDNEKFLISEIFHPISFLPCSHHAPHLSCLFMCLHTNNQFIPPPPLACSYRQAMLCYFSGLFPTPTHTTPACSPMQATWVWVGLFLQEKKRPVAAPRVRCPGPGNRTWEDVNVSAFPSQAKSQAWDFKSVELVSSGKPFVTHLRPHGMRRFSAWEVLRSVFSNSKIWILVLRQFL